MNTEKPRARPGSFCPLWRRDVSKVCHTCEMWETLKVDVIVAGAKSETVDHWACTLKHQTFVLHDLLRGVEGLQKSEESFRNTAWNETQQNLRDLIETTKHQTAFNTDVLRRVADGFSELARAVDARSPQIAPRTNGQLLEQK